MWLSWLLGYICQTCFLFSFCEGLFSDLVLLYLLSGIGLTYHGKAADVWALGCTLYCMMLGKFPFMGDTLHSTYDKVVTR